MSRGSVDRVMEVQTLNLVRAKCHYQIFK